MNSEEHLKQALSHLVDARDEGVRPTNEKAIIRLEDTLENIIQDLSSKNN